MDNQATYNYASTSTLVLVHQPGDGYEYSITRADKLKVCGKLSVDERNTYILDNFDIQTPVSETPFTRITVRASDGMEYSIVSPQKLEVCKNIGSGRVKVEYVKENYDEVTQVVS